MKYSWIRCRRWSQTSLEKIVCAFATDELAHLHWNLCVKDSLWQRENTCDSRLQPYSEPQPLMFELHENILLFSRPGCSLIGGSDDLRVLGLQRSVLRGLQNIEEMINLGLWGLNLLICTLVENFRVYTDQKKWELGDSWPFYRTVQLHKCQFREPCLTSVVLYIYILGA